MELIFEKVLERDIDLLMINKFITDDNILNLFLESIFSKNSPLLAAIK